MKVKNISGHSVHYNEKLYEDGETFEVSQADYEGLILSGKFESVQQQNVSETIKEEKGE